VVLRIFRDAENHEGKTKVLGEEETSCIHC
jgi:hypothetical protein